MTLHSILRSKADPSAGGPGADCYVLGSGPLGIAVARQLHAAGREATLIGADIDGLPTMRGDPWKVAVLSDAGVTPASTVVVALPDDGRNLLVAQLVSTQFGVTDVFVVVHAPDRSDLVAEAGHEPICATTTLADAIVDDVAPRLEEVDVA